MAKFWDNLRYKMFEALARSQGIPLDALHSQRGQMTNKEWSSDNAVREGFKASTYVYRAISIKSAAFIAADWKVYQLDRNGDREEVTEDHPLVKLLDRPSPYLDQKQFFERMLHFMELSGNAPVVKLRGMKKLPVQLWMPNPALITPYANEQELLTGYLYSNGTERYAIDPEDVIPFRYNDPQNIHWGLSPLQVVARTVDTDVDAVKWNRVAMGNRAVPDGAWSTDHDLTEQQHKEVLRQFRSQKQGWENARESMILGGGMKWQQMGNTPVEMDFIASRRMTREEMTAAFGVPLIMLGITEGSTYANYETARRSMWEDTIIPELTRIRSFLNNNLAPEFGEGLEIDYDVTNVPAMQEKEAEKIDRAEKLHRLGFSRDEIDQALELGFGETENGHFRYLPSSMVREIGDEQTPAPPTDPFEDEPIDPELAELEDQIKRNGDMLKKQLAPEPVAYWNRIEKKRDRHDTDFHRAIRARFAGERDAVLAALRSDGKQAAINAVFSGANIQAWNQLIQGQWRKIVDHFGQDAFDDLKSFAPIETKEDFDPYNSDINEHIRNYSGKKIRLISETTRNDLVDAMTDFDESQTTIDELAKAIENLYDGYDKTRSWTIARTEVAGASNYGIYAAGGQLPFKVEKQWVNSGDERVRDSHSINEIVPYDATFSNGLLFPGDPRGEAKEVIHCRCTIAFKQVSW